MERTLRAALKDGKDVQIDITPIYPPGSPTTRPDKFVVNTYVDGRHQPYEFENK